MAAAEVLQRGEGAPEAVCLIVDIDGFSGTDPDAGRYVIVPREIAVACFTLAAGKGGFLHKVDALYYRGGISTQFRQRNCPGVYCQSQKIHGFSLDDKAMAQKIPPGAALLELGESAADAAGEGEETASHRITAIAGEIDPALPLILMHKGGTEGRWLAPLALSISKTRPGAVSVVDLNSLGCPKAGTLLEKGPPVKVNCAQSVHGCVKDKSKWAHHCPQSECVALACWVIASCRADGATLTRIDALSQDGVIEALTAIVREQSPPALSIWATASADSRNLARCQNFIRSALQQKYLYASEDVIDATVRHICSGLAQALDLKQDTIRRT